MKTSLPIDTELDDDNGNVIDLGTAGHPINVLAGRHGIVTLILTLPTTGGRYFLDANLDPENTLVDVNLSNNTFASLTAIRLK